MFNRAACALLVTCITLPVALAGQGWIDPIRPQPSGRIEKLRSAVQVQVRGRVARVIVEEWFRNTGLIMGEGTYLYPLPGEAAFSEFSLWQGDRELKGEVMDATQARAIYEAIVRQKRDPALIELAGHGLIRARVFPIAPGETRKITLRYIQVLDRVGDAWRFRYASNRDATPRSFHCDVDDASRIGTPYFLHYHSPQCPWGHWRARSRTRARAVARGVLCPLIQVTRGDVADHPPAGERVRRLLHGVACTRTRGRGAQPAP